MLYSHLKQAMAASKEFLSEFNRPDCISSVFFLMGNTIINVKALED